MIPDHMKLTNVCLDKKEHKNLKRLCLEQEISMAEFIRQAIYEKLDRTLSTEEEADNEHK